MTSPEEKPKIKRYTIAYLSNKDDMWRVMKWKTKEEINKKRYIVEYKVLEEREFSE